MTNIQRSISRGMIACVIASAITVVAATASASTSAPTVTDCRRVSASLREHLEGVTEAVIDGRSTGVPRAADGAMLWWKANHRFVGVHPEADSLMPLLVQAAHRHAGVEAARIAVQLSSHSFAWCAGSQSTADRLMILDLAGMAGWLRARGAHLDWPVGVPQAADSLEAALIRRHRSYQAAHLRRLVPLLLSTPESRTGDIRPANELLQFVDELEKVLR